MKLVLLYKELISFVFSRAFAKNFDCRTYVRRRSFFTKNNFVSLALFLILLSHFLAVSGRRKTDSLLERLRKIERTAEIQPRTDLAHTQRGVLQKMHRFVDL